MIKKIFNKIELDNILTELKYYENFQNNFLERQYEKIDFGKRIGTKEFKSLFDAADQYTYSNQVSEEIFKEWNKILNNEQSTNEELFCTVLEIFNWGKVLNGNVKIALQLFKKKKLKPYIKQIIKHLKRKEILINDLKVKSETNDKIDIIWSSGWTKVYSFINNDILIYDSRVSAFLNHTLTYKAEYTDEQLVTLKKLTKFLFNFKGAENRERLVAKHFGFKNRNPNGIDGLNANLISSWIVELLKEKLNLNQDIRSFERAFFMLGFDLKQTIQG